MLAAEGTPSTVLRSFTETLAFGPRGSFADVKRINEGRTVARVPTPLCWLSPGVCRNAQIP